MSVAPLPHAHSLAVLFAAFARNALMSAPLVLGLHILAAPMLGAA